jgi:hypothetical protein
MNLQKNPHRDDPYCRDQIRRFDFHVFKIPQIRRSARIILNFF